MAAPIQANVLRVLQVAEELAIAPLFGLSHKEISETLLIPPATTTRDLTTLIEAGWVEKTPAGRFRLTPKPLGLWRAYALAIEQLKDHTALHLQDIAAAAPTKRTEHHD